MGPFYEGLVDVPTIQIKTSLEDAVAAAQELGRLHWDNIGLGDAELSHWDGDGWYAEEGSHGVALAFDSGARETFLVTNDGGVIDSDSETHELATTGLPDDFAGPLDPSLVKIK
jgi:hypothetical protein